MNDTIVKISGTQFTLTFNFECADDAKDFLRTAYEAFHRRYDDMAVEFTIYEERK